MKFEDMLIVLLIFVILFGGSKIPQLGAGLGKGIRSFKRGLEGKDADGEVPPAPAPTEPVKAEKDVAPKQQ